MVLEYQTEALVSRGHFMGQGLVSEAFLLALVSVLDWTDWGFLIKTGQESAYTVIIR